MIHDSHKTAKVWVLSGLSGYLDRLRLPLFGPMGWSCFSCAAPVGSSLGRPGSITQGREAFRNHTGDANRSPYSDPTAPGGLPKATPFSQTQLITVWNTRQPAKAKGQATEHLGSKNTAKSGQVSSGGLLRPALLLMPGSRRAPGE